MVSALGPRAQRPSPRRRVAALLAPDVRSQTARPAPQVCFLRLCVRRASAFYCSLPTPCARPIHLQLADESAALPSQLP